METAAQMMELLPEHLNKRRIPCLQVVCSRQLDSTLFGLDPLEGKTAGKWIR